MKYLASALILLTTLALSGCGSMLTTVKANPIEDDPGTRTWGEWVEDENIETKATVNIHNADPGLEDAHITVVSYGGYVLIVGQVADQRLKDLASEQVRNIRNVKRIYNELEVAGPTSAMTRTSDAWITTKVKSNFLTASEVEGYRVKVVTENGVVYLMGNLTQEEANRVSTRAADIGGVQRVVQIFRVIP